MKRFLHSKSTSCLIIISFFDAQRITPTDDTTYPFLLLKAEFELKMLKTRGWKWREGAEAGKDGEGGAGNIISLRTQDSRFHF